MSCVTVAKNVMREDATSLMSVRRIIDLTANMDGTTSYQVMRMSMPVLKANFSTIMRTACDIGSLALSTSVVIEESKSKIAVVVRDGVVAEMSPKMIRMQRIIVAAHRFASDRIQNSEE